MYSPKERWSIFRAGILHASMGQVLHGSVHTTAAIRRAIQHSQESLQGLVPRYSINGA